MQNIALASMVLGLGLIWGLHFSLMKIAAQSGLPFPALSLIVIFGNIIIFYIYCFFTVGRPKFKRKLWWFYLGCGVLGYLMPFFLEIVAAPRIGAGVLAVVVSLTPMLTLIIAVVTRTDRVTLRKLVGILLGFIGIFPLVAQYHTDDGVISWLGFAAALAVPLVYALYHNFVSRFWPDELSAAEVALGETIAGAILMTPIYLGSAGVLHVTYAGWSHYWFVGALIIASALEVYLYFNIVRIGGPVFVSQAGYITVISGVLWGSAIFGETANRYILLSIVVVLVSLRLVTPTTDPEKSCEKAVG